jgi:hypothetical protein
MPKGILKAEGLSFKPIIRFPLYPERVNLNNHGCEPMVEDYPPIHLLINLTPQVLIDMLL